MSLNSLQRVRKRTQRSSSLGPLLDEHKVNISSGLARSNKANTNSLESIDSNPRQAVPKGIEQVQYRVQQNLGYNFAWPNYARFGRSSKVIRIFSFFLVPNQLGKTTGLLTANR